MKYNLLAFSLMFLLFIGCEQNPIGDDKIDMPNRRISGTVDFGTNLSPEGVFVWLDGFDMFTYTDPEGKFEFFLPPPAAQANPKGVTGAFDVFYYVANYHLGRTRVYTQNGNFLYSGSEFNSEGELIQKKSLFRKLEAQIHVRPASAHSDSITVVAGTTDFLLRVDVALRTPKDSVIVFYPGLFQNTYNPLMFRNIETDQVKVLSSTIAGFVNSPYDTVDARGSVRTMAVPIFPNELGKGTFEVIPFIRVESTDIPEGIKRELELDSVVPGEKYLRIPFVRSGKNRYFTLQ